VLFGETLLDWIFDRVRDPRYGSLVSATLLFFVPTAIAGMVAPYSVRLLVLDQRLRDRSPACCISSRPSAAPPERSSPRSIS